ncbi:MAG: hypothetical protein KGJ82_10890 [Nitrospirota bacterium]|nr:hypothetical protein [Nitrospirota bacterium]
MPKRLLIPTELLKADTQAFFDVLNNEPDFSIVVVSTSYVDACLSALLQSFMLESSVSDKLLDSRSGALGSFAARSDAAYVMGLIPKTIYQDLQQLAEIRNQFAHHHLSLSFSIPAVEAACLKLKHLGTMKNGDIDEPAFPPDRMPPARERFKFTVMVISHYLIQASETMKRLEENV